MHAQTSRGLTTLTHQWNLRPGGYCSAPPPGVPGSAHGPASGREGGHTGPRSGESLGAGVRSCPPLTFTVSLGIFLLAASLRGQSSSVERQSCHPTSCSLASPIPQRGILHPHPGTSPGYISVLTWGYEFLCLGIFALEDDMRSYEPSCPIATQLPVQHQRGAERV